MTSPPFAIIAEFRIREGVEAEYLEQVAALLELNAADDGLLRFAVYRAGDDPLSFLFYEEWRDEEAFDASLQAAWRELYKEKVAPLWSGPRIMRRFHGVPIRWEAPSQE